VYVSGGNFPLDTNVTSYVIPDNMSASPDSAIATCWTLTDSMGEVHLTSLWTSPLAEGNYDIWVDVNQNGIYDETVDMCDHSVLDIYAFTVIPEFPSFIILPLFMIATLLAVIVYRRKQTG